MVLPFDKAAFSLDEGEISDIVKTRFGFHLIKVTDKKEYPPFKQVKDQLRKMYKKTRLEDDVEEYVNKLKEEFNFTVNDSVLTEIESANDTIKFSDNYIESDLRNSFKNAPVFTVNKKDFPLDSLVLNVQNKGKFKNKKITKDLMEDAIDEYSDRILLEQKAMGMVDDDPKFADLMKEYKNGIFVFKLQEDEVWNKMEVDSTDLYNYYQANKENYMYPERVNFSEIYSRSDSLINDYYAMLKQGANFDTLAAKFTERQGMREKAGNYGLKPVDFNAESKKADELSVGHYSEPFKVNRGWAIVKLKGRKQPSIMPFEEARPEVASDYQEVRSKELEEKYVESLKKRYNPKLYYEKLESAYKSEESESKE
jgi:peptidyl-prolyl cis-trans isomerase SurA